MPAAVWVLDRRLGSSSRTRGHRSQASPGSPPCAHNTQRSSKAPRDGLTQVEISRQLALSKGTIAFHVRNLGIAADERFNRRYDWAEVQRAIDAEGLDRKQSQTRFGFSKHAWYSAVKRGDITPMPHKVPIEELLTAGRRRGRGHVKRRLIREGLKENRCELCGISNWLGKPLPMQLHHLNGDGDDNRLENLQLLCANCHSQTHNWGGRGAARNGNRRRGHN